MNNTVLNVSKIYKAFGDVQVLKGIDMEVAEGEFITLLGESGCGKTTLLRIIAGLESPDTGRVHLEGSDVTDIPANRRNVNTVFQSYALFPHMTIEVNVGYALKIKKIEKNRIRQAVQKALSLVRLEGFEKRYPSELSGGQAQRVAIARALVANPKVLLLDEPLGALDAGLRRQMQSELKRLQKQLGITFINITHDCEEAINMSDRIAVMNGGVFEQFDTVSEIYAHPRTAFVARFLENANIFHIRGTSIAVRPEHIVLTAADASATGHLVGVVTDKSFAGGQLRIQIELADATTVVATAHGIDSPIGVSDRVVVGWAEEDGMIVVSGQ
jgi:spermidine/putrescine transport system ATP-binding protein